MEIKPRLYGKLNLSIMGHTPPTMNTWSCSVKVGDLVRLKERWKNKDFIWERDIPHPDAVAIVVEDWDTNDNFVVWFAGASAPIDFSEDNAWVDDLLEKVQ
jgi:hypothetical protein